MDKTLYQLPTFFEALKFWLKLGLISFGGPAGQIAIMHRELVETKRWLDDKSFMNGLNFCMFLPGPEAQQLAIYLGWRLHGAIGGIVAGVLFVLPSAFILFGLSWLFIAGDNLPWVAHIFHGLLGAVIAILLDAVFRIGGKSLRSISLFAIAGLSFVAIFFFNINFVIIVFLAGVLGLIGNHWMPSQFPAGQGHGKKDGEESDFVCQLPPAPAATWGRTFRILAVTLTLWWGPIIALGIAMGWDSTPAQQGLFFSKAAMVTFGGAYAVLPYVAQSAVDQYGWLSNTQMMSGLAETTPGPLIMVLQFVGFVGGWQNPGDLSPWMGALIGSAITTWVTFLPCFLFVFLGAPWIEKIGNMPKLAATLRAITACVVGVILNLGVKFTTSALWPAGGTFEVFILAVAIASFIAIRFSKSP
jgi:chromate transporter